MFLHFAGKQSTPNHVESNSHGSGRSPLDSPKLRMPEDSQQKYVLKAMEGNDLCGACQSKLCGGALNTRKG